MDTSNLASLVKYRKDSELGSKYQKLFEPFGIEVVTAVYLAYPKEGDDINSIYKRTFRKDVGDIRQLVVDPTPIIGIFHDKYDERYENKNNRAKNVDLDISDNILIGGQFESKVILLVLYKDGGFRTVIFGEILEASNISLIGQGIGQKITRKDGDLKYSMSVLTLDADKNPCVTNVGKSISNKERGLLVEQILASTVNLWVGQDATKNIVSKIDKKQLVAKLKRVGIGSLGMPFAAVAVVGTLSVATVTGLVQEMQA